MSWYQQRPERMQTDLNCINLWEEKYKNKAVLRALNNSLYFFFWDNNCHRKLPLIIALFCADLCTYLEWSTIPKDRNGLSFIVEEAKTPRREEVTSLCLRKTSQPRHWAYSKYPAEVMGKSTEWWTHPRDQCKDTLSRVTSDRRKASSVVCDIAINGNIAIKMQSGPQSIWKLADSGPDTLGITYKMLYMKI